MENEIKLTLQEQVYELLDQREMSDKTIEKLTKEIANLKEMWIAKDRECKALSNLAKSYAEFFTLDN